MKDIYTVKDYQLWPDDERWELIDGAPFMLPSGETTVHQTLVGETVCALQAFLKGKPCRVFAAPCDVYLSDDENGDTVVQPDVLVVCDPAKITRRGIVGAPDIVVEVLSPSTASRDFAEKFLLYQREGVPEYWIVLPEERAVLQYTLKERVYEVKRLTEGELVSTKLPGFTLDIAALFAALDGLPEE